MKLSAILLCITIAAYSQELPTNYEYYTSGGISSGLSADQPDFLLNGKTITIYSGAIHYFRVPRAYWRDRLRKLRAAGFNTVETCVAWNIHEPRSGEFDFGNGGNDLSDFANLAEFIQIAKEEDLFVILRVGPFICAEWEFGGYPSWLLREDGIEVRTSNAIYMNYVTRYFNALLAVLAPLQFTNGGPVIMFQVENEYANSRKSDTTQYLTALRNLMLSNGIKELLVTADNPDRGSKGTIPELFLMTGTFYKNSTEQLDWLTHFQPNKPKMAMENYPGWFDFWGRRHNHKPGGDFLEGMEETLTYPASVNIYMFHGGTSFGFTNGAQNLKLNEFNTDYHSITNSYYVSPLNEAGEYTDLYYSVKALVAKYNTVQTKLPDPPQSPVITAYETIEIQQQMTFDKILETLTPVQSHDLVSMEKLNINNNNGQSFGYIVYRKTDLNIPAGAVLQIDGRVCDTVMVLVNGLLISPWISRYADLQKFGSSMIENSTIVLSETDLNGATLELVVENWGRINVAVYEAFKGLWQGGVSLNGNYLYDWAIYPLEFQKSWTNSLQSWQQVDYQLTGPCLYKSTLQIDGNPTDTFVYMQNWTRGIVIVNGFVLSRYAHMGPVQTLYLPAPFLRSGQNDIIIFEHYKPYANIEFRTSHVYANF